MTSQPTAAQIRAAQVLLKVDAKLGRASSPAVARLAAASASAPTKARAAVKA